MHRPAAPGADQKESEFWSGKGTTPSIEEPQVEDEVEEDGDDDQTVILSLKAPTESVEPSPAPLVSYEEPILPVSRHHQPIVPPRRSPSPPPRRHSPLLPREPPTSEASEVLLEAPFVVNPKLEEITVRTLSTRT